MLVFPGQGSQRPAMGMPWRDHPSWQLVGRLSEATGRDLAELLLSATPEVLRETRNAQLATFAFSLVVLDAALAGPLADLPATSWGAVAGHSLGEYSALVAANALAPEEGARLVRARADAMQQASEANPGTMAAVIGLELAQLVELCQEVEGAWVANDNAPGQVVVAGTHEGVAKAGERAVRAGAKRVVPLQVSGAFHTPLMAPAQPALEEALQRVSFQHPDCPVVANVDAAPHVDGFPALLAAQLCSRVRWRESLATLARGGARLLVELGPGTELSGMARRAVPGLARANIASPSDLAALVPALAAAR